MDPKTRISIAWGVVLVVVVVLWQAAVLGAREAGLLTPLAFQILSDTVPHTALPIFAVFAALRIR